MEVVVVVHIVNNLYEDGTLYYFTEDTKNSNWPIVFGFKRIAFFSRGMTLAFLRRVGNLDCCIDKLTM